MILISLIYIIIYSFINLLLGLILLKALFREKLRTLSAIATLSSSFLLGQSVLASIWLLIGLTGYFNFFLILAVQVAIIVISIITWPDLMSLVKETTVEIHSLIKKLSLFWKLLFLATILLVLSYALGAIILPLSGDAEAFYMVLPKLMAYTGRLFPQPNYIEFSQIGLMGEMHFAALMTIADPLIAKFFVWMAALAAVGMLFALGQLSGLKARGQVVMLIILFTSTTFTNYLADGKVDVLGAALGLATYYWALQTKKENGWLPLALTGLFMGFAFIAKFPNLLVILPGVLVILGWNTYLDYRTNRKPLKQLILSSICSLGIILAFFLLSITPHLIKNGMLFGEPLAPFIFFEPQGLKWAEQTWFSAENTRFILLTYPLALTFGQYPMQGGNLSVLFLTFLPLIFFKQKNTLIEKQVLFMATIGLIVWMVLQPSIISPRYILATLLLFIPIVVSSFENLLDQQKYHILKIIGISGILAILSIGLIDQVKIIKQFMQIMIGSPNPLSFSGPNYKALYFINQKAADNEKIFLVGYYGFYLKPELLAHLSTNKELLEVAQASVNAWDYFADHGYHYIIVQKATHSLFLNNLTEQSLSDELKIKNIYEDNSAVVFTLNTKGKNDQK